MLPKVATHILHTSTRAAAAVHNQTHTFRNVLQLQSSGPSSGSGSGRSNGGPGPGSAKYNAGSRFYSGFNGAGRAVTQANTVTSHDGSFSQNDEVEDLTPRRSRVRTTTKRSRIRSSSLSLNLQARHERGEKLGVLQTVQLHTQARHVFTPNKIIEENAVSPSRPVLVRRNSTSSSDGLDAPLLPIRRNSTVAHLETSTDIPLDVPPPPPPRTQPTKERVPSPTKSNTRHESEITRTLKEALQANDGVAVAEAVRKLQASRDGTLTDYNWAITGLIETRRASEPLNMILETYNTMLKQSILPNFTTYIRLIQVLTERDEEVHRMTQLHDRRQKRAHLIGRLERAVNDVDVKRVKSLLAEDNFDSAMSLFAGLEAIGGLRFVPAALFTSLIRACAHHANVDAAIHVFAQLEARPDLEPNPTAYRYMIQAYANADVLEGTEMIFSEFLSVSKSGKSKPSPDYEAFFIRSSLLVWNQMIETYFRFGLPEKALELVDQMLASKPGLTFTPGDVPIVTSSTFTTVIAGFCRMGDIATALTWFDRLLLQGQISANPFEGLGGQPMKPDSVAWSVMLDELALQGMTKDLNRLFKILLRDAESDGMKIMLKDRLLVYSANMARIADLPDTEAIEILQFLEEAVWAEPELWRRNKIDMIRQAALEYISRNSVQEAIRLTSLLVEQEMRFLQDAADSPESAGISTALHYILTDVAKEIYNLVEQRGGTFSFAAALQLSRLFQTTYLQNLDSDHAPHLLNAYSEAKREGTIPFEELVPQDWEGILDSAILVETAAVEGQNVTITHGGLITLLQDMASHGVDIASLNVEVIQRVMRWLTSQTTTEDLKPIFEQLGPSYLQILEEATRSKFHALEAALTPPSSPSSEQSTMQDFSHVMIDQACDKSVTECLNKSVIATQSRHTNPDGQRNEILKAYERLQQGLTNNKAPGHVALTRLIECLGRMQELDKVRLVYTVAQQVLLQLQGMRDWQAKAWHSIENGMIIGLAHGGDVDAAYVHRARILENGGAPSADAYGALILCIADTTDDASAAMALFQESQQLEVKPNIFLFNNIISKLSRARKADYALEIFQQLKASGINPSSITYGAVIGACARVGDIQSAETLFTEMIHAKNFKPRVPPFNTMMQLYTSTRPNRERGIYYYSQLLRANIRPTAHTYKLLLDLYGAIEPVDINAMEAVFESLQKDKNVKVQGTHIASLIHAHGCVLKDLDKAISIFDAANALTWEQPPDAVVYEAIIDALVAHRRTDLVPEYIAKMNAAGIHMTAYIANFLIKGYALIGDMQNARQIFESLSNPPLGIAAPNNHAPHDPSIATPVNHMEPVYREPSTWEVMIRAELGAGEHDRAVALLDRLKERHYPEAVYNRISGILVDHSIVS